MGKLKFLTKNFGEFGRAFYNYPFISLEEVLRLSLNSLGIRQRAGKGILFESHCHTNFPCETTRGVNDGMPLEKLIITCFKRGIKLLSVTDHRNCNAFDSLVNKGLKGYDIEKTSDRRYTIIHRGGKKLIALRAAEFWTDQGEVNVHGFSDNYPYEKLLTLEDISKFAKNNGSFWVINHPLVPYQGLDRKAIDKSIALGADAIEMNSLIILFLYSSIIARTYEKRIPVIAGSDAHYPRQIGNALLEFDREVFEAIEKKPVEQIRKLISERRYKTTFNYSSIFNVIRLSIEHPPSTEKLPVYE